MKHTLILLSYACCLLPLAVPAALPQTWDVDLAAQPPQVFTLQRPRGETYELEAVLNVSGKPFEPAITNACIYWQTNGMANLYWAAPASVSNNVLRAFWLPEMDPGATTVRGYIGDPGHIYAAAFQFRFIASPGPTPNVLPLPTPVIDFAKVRVLNPPWESGGGGGVNTNAVRDIAREEIATATNALRKVDGAARPLPKYLHALDFADSYQDSAAEYYRSRGNGKTDGGCSAVRSGGYLYRNFDFPFDDRAEFVVRMSAGPGRFASVGVAQVGTNLTEEIVTSGKPSRCYKWLPGATVDGVNEYGVVAEINVVDTQVTGWHTNATSEAIHPLAAVRWVLDHATNAQHSAEYIAANIRFPQGWKQNFHYMIADAGKTYIVENGTVTDGDEYHEPDEPVTMTNFQLSKFPWDGMGMERFGLLLGGANITNAWYTRAYRRETNPPWVSDLADVIAYTNEIFDAWAAHQKEYFRNQLNGGQPWWQSVHTSIYDISNRVLRVAVQEVDDWYTFAVPATASKIDAYTRAETDAKLAEKVDTNDFVTATNNLTSSVSRLESSKIPYDEWGGISMHEYNFKENGVDRGSLTTCGVVINDEDGYPKANVSWPDGDGKFALDSDVAAAQSSADAAAAKADEALASANDANVWSSATYNFMTGGRTNCWFSGTNYVFGTDAATRTRFDWEDGMDAATVPCSMALWEIRDGERQLVWDQRDWTAWYWSFKSRQMMATVKGQIDALGNAVTNDSNYAWAKRYASDGTPNPDRSTTFIDTPSVTLSPGMKWETVATVSGAAYWTIVGNGAVIGGSGTNAVLRITDFEGNDIMTVTKGEHRLAWLERGDITGSLYDSDGWVCFDMLADVEPVGYLSTTLESSDFLPQTDPNCPAQYRWENIGGGKYRVHFLLKPGISSNTCFAKFQVEVEGQTIIRYNAGQEISGGLIYNGVKIAPDISGSPAVGTVIQWKVVH